MPRGVRALAVGTAVALAVLIGLSALVGAGSTALAVGFASVVLAWGWVRLTDAPAPRVAAVVLGAGAVAIAAAAGLTRTDPYLVWVPVAVAVSVMAAFLHQVLRGNGRPRLTEGLASSVSALAVMASGAAFIPLPSYPHGGSWALVAVLGVAAASLPALLLGGRLAPGWVLLAALVLGTGASVVAAVLLTGIALVGAALVGVLVRGDLPLHDARALRPARRHERSGSGRRRRGRRAHRRRRRLPARPDLLGIAASARRRPSELRCLAV